VTEGSDPRAQERLDHEKHERSGAAAPSILSLRFARHLDWASAGPFVLFVSFVANFLWAAPPPRRGLQVRDWLGLPLPGFGFGLPNFGLSPNGRSPAGLPA
jgi:hypothetical protein